MHRVVDEDGNTSAVAISDSAMQGILTAAMARARGADGTFVADLAPGADAALASVVSSVGAGGGAATSGGGGGGAGGGSSSGQPRLAPLSSLLFSAAPAGPAVATTFDHVPGSRICDDVSHVALPDGRLVHVYVRTEEYDCDVPSRTRVPLPPTSLAALGQGGNQVPALPALQGPVDGDLPSQLAVALAAMLPPALTPPEFTAATGGTAAPYTFRIRFSCTPKPLPTPGADGGSGRREVAPAHWPAFAARLTGSETKGYMHSMRTLDRCFRYDWRRIEERDGLRVVMFWAGGEKVDAVRACLRRHYVALSELFDYLAAGSPSEPFVIQLSAYQRMIDTFELAERGSKYCSQRDLDVIFIQANRDPDGALDADITNPARALIRYEFLEAVVRIACAKLLAPGKAASLTAALDTLVDDVLAGPRLVGEWGSDLFMRGDAYRERRVYTREVDAVLVAHAPILANVHRAFARHTVLRYTPSGPVKHVLPVTDEAVQAAPLMSWEGWVTLMAAAKLLDDNFGEAEAGLAFSAARMRVSNDVDVKNWTPATHLALPDFYEALCRVADMKSLPTDEEVAAAGTLATWVDNTPVWRTRPAPEVFSAAATATLAPRLQKLIGIILRRLELFIATGGAAVRRASSAHVSAAAVALREVMAAGK